jgi:hypothetical protein
MKLIKSIVSLWNKWFDTKPVEPVQQYPLPREFRKLSGFTYVTVLCEWVSVKFPLEHVIILTNINVEAKNIHFWAKVPKTDAIEFTNDVVVLRCTDTSEMWTLITNIGEDFADAYGFCAGKLTMTNKERE